MTTGRELYRFGEMTPDVPERRLSRNGQSIPLSPKAYDVLVHLVRHSGRLVAKGDLLDATGFRFPMRSPIPSPRISTQTSRQAALPASLETGPTSGAAFYARRFASRFMSSSAADDRISCRYRRLALLHSEVGDLDIALQHLMRAIDSHEPCLVDLAVAPQRDRLRAHPNFQHCLERMGLTRPELCA